jgi:replicative DNA helicase
MQPLPHNEQIEKELLGMVFIKNDILINLITTLTEDDFYNSTNTIIYSEMVNMYKRNIPIDMVTFSNSLGERLKAIGGITFLTQLIGCTSTTTQHNYYIKVIKELSDKRKAIRGCQEFLLDINKPENETHDLINRLENSFINLGTTDREGTVDAENLMQSTVTAIEEGQKNGGQITGITTGFKKLDENINGLMKDDLIIIAARPSIGKTALILNIINNIPKGHNVALFEMEMSKEKIGIRILASNTLRNSTDLSKGNVPDKDMLFIINTAGKFSEKNNLFLNCRAGLTLQEIRSEAKKIKIKNGLDVLVVDHIGKIIPDNLKATRNDQIGQISEGLKDIAKELHVCVVALSQLSRKCEERSDKHPMLSDLRDSGNIEQDADTVLLLYRDDYYAARESRDSKKLGILEIMIAKNRDGRAGLIELIYNTNYQKITEKYNGLTEVL